MLGLAVDRAYDRTRSRVTEFGCRSCFARAKYDRRLFRGEPPPLKGSGYRAYLPAIFTVADNAMSRGFT